MTIGPRGARAKLTQRSAFPGNALEALDEARSRRSSFPTVVKPLILMRSEHGSITIRLTKPLQDTLPGNTTRNH